jgi:fatty acid desaturase
MAPKKKSSQQKDETLAQLEKLVENDLRRERKEHLFPAPQFVANAVLDAGEQTTSTPYARDDKDPRIPMLAAERRMLDAIWSLSLVSIAEAVLMFMFATETWHGLLYSLTKLLLLERFMLVLHFSQHRFLFKGQNPFMQTLNYFMPFVIAPTFGMFSGAYELHHVIMHHRGNNLYPNDISQTMTYQRDSVFEFIKYWLRYAILGPFELAMLGVRLKFNSGLMKMIVGVLLQVAVTYRLYPINPVACFWVLIIPHFYTSAAIMFGNWSQHIFVEPSDAGNSYKLTYNCVDAPMNSLTFNDGYHIAHHLQGGRHWSKLPLHQTKFYDRYVQNESFVFEGVGFVDVGFYVMTGQLEKLCNHVVLPVLPRPKLIELMKRRLQSIKVRPGQTFKIT